MELPPDVLRELKKHLDRALTKLEALREEMKADGDDIDKQASVTLARIEVMNASRMLTIAELNDPHPRAAAISYPPE